MVTGAPPDFWRTSDEEIYKKMLDSTGVDGINYLHGRFTLEIRHARRLAQFTKQLIWATWAVAFASAVLAAATIVSIWPAIHAHCCR